MYCPYCGNEVTSAMSYCPYCGAELVSGTGTALTLSSARAGGEYRLILVSKGSSTQVKTIDLLTDLLGYTETMAQDLYENAPVEIAEGLNAEQAKCLAQAFTEYGIEVSVSDPYGTVTLQNSSANSLFSSDGNLLASAAAILATITALNRVNSFRRYSRPSLLERLFRLAFRPKEPPRHIRRRIPKYIHEEPRHFQAFRRSEPVRREEPVHHSSPRPSHITSRERHRPMQKEKAPSHGGRNDKHGRHF